MFGGGCNLLDGNEYRGHPHEITCVRISNPANTPELYVRLEGRVAS